MKLRYIFFFSLIGGLGLLTWFLWPQLPAQDSPAYFAFADDRLWWGIPHFGDVVSNLAFVVVGFSSYFQLQKSRKLRPRHSSLVFGQWLALGLIAVGLGSSYFHWNPTAESVFWDRLPMAVCFMSVLTIVLGDRLGEKGIKPLGYFLIAAGVWSVWNIRFGSMDLRPYLVVQFGSMLVVLAAMPWFPEGRIRQRALFFMLALYVLAKILELEDASVYMALEIFSGHNLKHLAAAAATWVFLRELV